ncbi:Very-long-chain 3-oxoacyl-CoA reductase [Pleurostoma richardsiae]|uniref:Very-long-chain 3-oxoacyl-CoA reductase n=1 Tax=Pleurostoma richardsiae TaxID=41990 RepID=A0AA38VQH5_9PEZI|nr:Very-long-chain 3-oxoacyl-CoA reductase [Pleurostoma richardsiae]
MGALWLSVLATVGAVAIARLVYCAADFIAFHLITPSRPLTPYKRAGKQPVYALVTGASAGIGFGVAQELVKQGFGVVLLGHLAGELAEAADALRKLTADAAVRTLVVDARTATPAELDAAIASVADLRVTILVNNVGSNPVAHPPFRPLATYSAADIDAVIDMNARFMARLTALMLPVLSQKGGPEERSLIINMSSGAWVGSPWLVMYGATKAFNLGFSRGLARELEVEPATRHVDCLAIVPGDVLSQGNSVGVPSSAPNSDEYGRCIVHKVDGALRRQRRDTAPYWLHGIQTTILDVVPESAVTRGMTDMLRHKRDAFNAVYQKTR